MRHHFINLTNGLEAIDDILITNESWSFCRIRSTTIEKHNWWSLFNIDIDNNLLMRLALGYECIIHDRGTNRPLSKTIFYAIPLITYVLEKTWFEINPENVYALGKNGGKGLNLIKEFSLLYDEIIQGKNEKSAITRKRLNYYKQYTKNNKVNLIGYSKSTKNDGNYEYMKTIADKIRPGNNVY